MVKKSFEKSRGDGKDKSPLSNSQSESAKRLRQLRISHLVYEQSPNCQTTVEQQDETRYQAERRRKGKEPASLQRKDQRPVDKYDKPIEKQIILSDRYGKENPGLPGGGWLDDLYNFIVYLANPPHYFTNLAAYEALRNRLLLDNSTPDHDAGPSSSHEHASDIPNCHPSHSLACPDHDDGAPPLDYDAAHPTKIPTQDEALRNRLLLNNSTPDHDAGPSSSHEHASDIPDYHPSHSLACPDHDDGAPPLDYDAAHPTKIPTQDEALRNRRPLNNSTPDHDAGPSSSHEHAPREKKYEHREKVYLNKKSKDGSINGKDKIKINIERMIVHKKGIIKEIASATTGYHEPNEDSCFISKYGGGVFDGVSQGGRGAEASRMAKEFFEQELPELFGTIKRDRLSSEQIEAELKRITLETNNEINRKLNKNAIVSAETTLSVAMPIGDGKMTAVNVGDSRVYVLTKDGKLKHITTDNGPFGNSKDWKNYQRRYGFSGLKVNKEEQKRIQEKVANINDDEIRKIIKKNKIDTAEELKIKYAIKRGNMLSQALGSHRVKPNMVTFDINPGDRVIITSDGVHDNLSDKEIFECVSTSETAEDAVRALVKTSRENSLDKTRSRCKQDDTTAVVIECS
jgi:serine/threonine protein phosphatase PrpC